MTSDHRRDGLHYSIFSSEWKNNDEMDLYGQQSRSIPQKIVIHLIELAIIWLSYWILFQGGGTWFEEHLHIQNASGGSKRRMIIFLFNIIIFVRISFAMIFLIKRKMPWEESISIPIAFALYYIGYSLFALPNANPIDGLDYFAIFLFLLGCTLNSGGEIMRHRWKVNPENKGKLYTGGFFRYSRHINYFGDLLWLTGYALVSKNWYAAIVPVALFCFFAFYNAPKLDSYLKEKYASQYDEFAKKTKMLIPFIY